MVILVVVIGFEFTQTVTKYRLKNPSVKNPSVNRQETREKQRKLKFSQCSQDQCRKTDELRLKFKETHTSTCSVLGVKI